MDRYDIYQQIAERTQGDIYIGVVGPVRTGKSTFIKRFMDLLVIPNIENEYNRERAKDELPQSATGRSIMTTEPKFVPNEAVRIVLDDNVEMNVRLVDCVGYLVKGALGYFENNAPRMVSTPWFDYQVPFQEAAEIGTRKVIKEHSTIGLVVTSDGSVCEVTRNEYTEAEERVIEELKQLNKPFVILLNSMHPNSDDTLALRGGLEEKYGVPAISLDVANMDIEDINGILGRILLEFPVTQIGFNFPKWVDALDEDSALRIDLLDSIKETFKGVSNIREAKGTVANLNNYDFIKNARIEKASLGNGNILVELEAPDGLFYRTMSEVTGFDISDDFKLAGLLKNLAGVKRDYDKIETALKDVRQKGYGIVVPNIDELTLEEPEIIKQGNRFGVKLRASAPSIHMILADIETEIAPLVGSEKQSEDLVNYLLREYEGEPGKLWESDIFGKSLHELVTEGLYNKLNKMPDDARLKLQETLSRIINEGSAGLICIIL